MRVWKCLWGNHVPGQRTPTPHAQLPAPVSVRGPVLALSTPPAQRMFHILGVLGRWTGWRLGPRPASLHQNNDSRAGLSMFLKAVLFLDRVTLRGYFQSAFDIESHLILVCCLCCTGPGTSIWAGGLVVPLHRGGRH